MAAPQPSATIDPDDGCRPTTFEEERLALEEAEADFRAGRVLPPERFDELLAALVGDAPWPEIDD